MRVPLYKTKQFFFVLIKLSIVVVVFYMIYQKLLNNDALSFSDFKEALLKSHVFSLKNGILLIGLTCFNWFFEVLKWKILVAPVKKISFYNAFEQSLGALTASLLTPNRIGEYGAKAMYYASPFRKRILLVNVISNLLQMGVTCLLGGVGFVLYVLKYNPEINQYKIGGLFIFVIMVMLLFGFAITRGKFSIKAVSLKKVRLFISEYQNQKGVLSFLLSLGRYIVFSFQFYLLLHFFKISLNYFDTMVIITSMYLLVSVIPSVFIFDVVVKGGVAVFLFSVVGISEFVILSVVTTMWVLNFVIPSILGSYYVLRFNFSKKTI